MLSIKSDTNVCLGLLLATIHIFNMQAQVKRGIYPNLCSSLSAEDQKHLLTQPGQSECDSMRYSRKISEVEATQAEFFFQKLLPCEALLAEAPSIPRLQCPTGRVDPVSLERPRCAVHAEATSTNE